MATYSQIVCLDTSTICTLGSRTYTKNVSGFALCAYYHVSLGYTGPIVCSTDQSVAHYTPYGTGDPLSTEINGTTWYYTNSDGFTAGDLTVSSGNYTVKLGSNLTPLEACQILVGMYYDLISTSVNPVGSGTVNVGGAYPIELTAIPNVGFAFNKWELSGYTILDYLQSSGTQYLDTLVSFTSNPANETSVEIKFNATSIASSTVLCGCENNGNTWNFAVQFTGSGFRIYHATLSAWQTTSISANTDYLLKMEQNGSTFTRTLNGTSVSATTSFTGASRTFTLFADSTTNYGYNQFSSVKIYYCKIVNNGTLVRDFIPVIRNSDGQLGMLDLLNMKFYKNNGTGTFLGGEL